MNKILLLFLLLSLCSCKINKMIPEGEDLYTGAKVKMVPKEPVDHEKDLHSLLKGMPKPKPNTSIFGWRPRVWLFLKMGKTNEKGFKHWVKYKMGEKPVYYSDVRPEKVVEAMMNRMENKGYFHSLASYIIDRDEKKREVKLVYLAKPRKRYMLNKYDAESGDDSLHKDVMKLVHTSKIKPGDPFDLDVLKEERSKIDEYLKNHGYFYFNPDYLIFQTDTSIGRFRYNLHLKVKNETPDNSFHPYRINDIFVFTNYSLSKDSLLGASYGEKKKEDGNYYFVNQEHIIRNKALAHNIYLESGNLYSRRDHNYTLSRLMGMGIFKFANIRFQPGQGKDSVNKLDALVYLTPSPKKSLRMEIEGVSRSNSYNGPQVKASFRNRSAFKGSELFILNVNGSFETQFGAGSSGLNSYELGTNAQLFLPKFVSPFRVKKESSEYVPKTKFEGGFRYVDRVKYFQMNSVNFNFGYRWKEISTKEHDLNPISLSIVNLESTTPAFEAILQKNPFLRKSFTNQFILGTVYSFTYNGQLGKPRRNQFFFNGIADIAGNSLKLLSGPLGLKENEEGRKTLFGRPFSQYAKLTLDLRYYHHFDDNRTFVSRIITGAGFPYGNSEVMPYVKQYFSGGSNSIRAFHPRSVGPGTYMNDTASTIGFSDQAGDLKFEYNLEYRFPIISVVKGAWFADAGNVWLVRDNPSLPGGAFKGFKSFGDLAIGAGFGIRVDVSFLVIRLDIATPLRKPANTDRNWVVKDIKPGSPGWRKENLVFNIAIGYPF